MENYNIIIIAIFPIKLYILYNSNLYFNIQNFQNYFEIHLNE